MNHRKPSKLLLRTCLTVLLGACACVVPASAASAAKSSSPTQQIISNGYSSINTIRSFFFCETAACKKDKKATATSAAVAMNYLEGEASALKPSNAPKSQRPILKKFIDDVTTLAKVYSVYSTETTSTEIATNTGVLYYVSANVGSDIYLLTSAVAASKVIFADWGVGAVAVLYTMQVDNQVLTSKKSNAATDIGAINDLEQDAVALRKDANGPSEHFNALLVTFANAQVEVCKAERDILEKKKSSLTNAQLKADISKIAVQFAKIVDLQKTLSK
jgi:hypothetical protein